MTQDGSDTGLANERTSLAWQRTALSLVVAAAVVGRLTVGRLGPTALVVLVIAAALSLWVFGESRRRYDQQLGDGAQRRERGGRATLSLAVATLLIALTEGVALLVG